MGVVIFQRAFSPLTKMVIEIRPETWTAFLSVIEPEHTVQFLVIVPSVTAQKEWPEGGAITGNEIEIVGVLTQVACVIRKIKNRHVA